jgi:hypothetical protein
VHDVAAAAGSINSCQSNKQLHGTRTETSTILKFDLHFLETLVGEGCPITIYNNHVLKLESITQ